MKIVAVKVSRGIRAGLTVIRATERAWALSLEKCMTCDYVIAVHHGRVVGYFRKLTAYTDPLEPPKVAFDLLSCTESEIESINAKIEGVPLEKIQRGRYIY